MTNVKKITERRFKHTPQEPQNVNKLREARENLVARSDIYNFIPFTTAKHEPTGLL